MSSFLMTIFLQVYGRIRIRNPSSKMGLENVQTTSSIKCQMFSWETKIIYPIYLVFLCIEVDPVQIIKERENQLKSFLLRIFFANYCEL